MLISIEVPDDVARVLDTGNGADLPRSLLEMIALEGYRSEQLTHAEVMSLLGMKHPLEVEQFLKVHGVSLSYTIEDMMTGVLLDSLLEYHRSLRSVSSQDGNPIV